ncbi:MULTISPECIES: hypothetical protein [Streptomyces]|uniref:Uncharacterized protein n=1 Tax=Streptomyces glycanivorans TaxID=3033808 RepID=A0ABY9JIK6_9ACTN|nr:MULTISPECIES: hypothetical protein [unclassified Streptomyces]WSQ79777.1 hypothetical protein OG725_22950 [Streptomyces sp. NBC_01213]WLQ66329.1 hypothetical protein P8A20_23355 [Streptomyces sp. Alt3]WSQ87157.1 hypothetical protein OG722_23630 [Streptomyces sp. NBC_01212]WSR06827.1 hypothetical protein OG265_12790 [Streptomyces sp. NBC_01208]WSR50434.1 hypothetical protein OG279_23640 [Streptomyces sp. NBC_01201]
MIELIISILRTEERLTVEAQVALGNVVVCGDLLSEGFGRLTHLGV